MSLVRRCAVVVVLLLFVTVLASAQSTGSISGTVSDAVSGAPLAGADVALDGTAFITATDRTGAFLLTGVPTGEYSLLVLYLGHTDERASVTVSSGRSVSVEVSLRPASFSEVVQVTATPIGEGQAQALNQQRTALNITNVVSADQIGSFPDPNAAESAQRIPGVSITRDQGEGRYVLVRGTEPRLNSMMIDGERIPAPEGDARQVALDAVPADQLQSIEVSKAVTPDMDADSIGGAVNSSPSRAVGRPTMLFSAAGGYNALQEDAGQSRFSGTVGRRIAGGRTGLLLGGSASALNRGSENFEATYDDGELADFQNRDYQIERLGVNGADVQLGLGSSLVFRGIFNEFKDYEINNRYPLPPVELANRVRAEESKPESAHPVAGCQWPAGGPQRHHDGLPGPLKQSQEEQLRSKFDTIFRQSRIPAPNVDDLHRSREHPGQPVAEQRRERHPERLGDGGSQDDRPRRDRLVRRSHAPGHWRQDRFVPESRRQVQGQAQGPGDRGHGGLAGVHGAVQPVAGRRFPERPVHVLLSRQPGLRRFPRDRPRGVARTLRQHRASAGRGGPRG
ncbi:MAG: TonB-dependent receptor plug domain-containing protein [Vicinamibacterales bacterium]